MMSLKSVRKHLQQLHVHKVRGLAALCFCPLEDKNSQQTFSVDGANCVYTDLRPDKHAGLLTNLHKPLIKK